MAFEPKPPPFDIEPEQIAPDTFVIHSVQKAMGGVRLARRHRPHRQP